MPGRLSTRAVLKRCLIAVVAERALLVAYSVRLVRVSKRVQQYNVPKHDQVVASPPQREVRWQYWGIVVRVEVLDVLYYLLRHGGPSHRLTLPVAGGDCSWVPPQHHHHHSGGRFAVTWMCPVSLPACWLLYLDDRSAGRLLVFQYRPL